MSRKTATNQRTKKSAASKQAKTDAKIDASYSKLDKAGYVVPNVTNKTGKLSGRMAAGHAIQAVINAGPVTVEEIAKRVAPLGITAKRVAAHVEFERSIRKRVKLDAKKRVVLIDGSTSVPNWRTAGADGKAKKPAKKTE